MSWATLALLWVALGLGALETTMWRNIRRARIRNKEVKGIHQVGITTFFILAWPVAFLAALFGG